MGPLNECARRQEPYNNLGCVLDDVYTLVFIAFSRRELPFCATDTVAKYESYLLFFYFVVRLLTFIPH